MSDALAVASSPPPEPPADDNISLGEYFEDLFVPENKLRIPVKRSHHEICDEMESAILGELDEAIEFVCVTMPPRIGKTKINEALSSYAEGYFPDAQIIMTSYADDLAKLSLDYVSNTMRSPWYVDFFGDLVHGDKDDHLSTTAGGNIYAEGVYGGMLGKGAGLKEHAGGHISLDDPSKAEQALSKNVAKKLEVQFETTITSRRNSDRCCPIFIIAQRLGLNDLVEYLKRTYPRETLVLKFPAYGPNNAVYFPETWSLKTKERLEKTRIGRWTLAAMLNQDPHALGGNMIPVDKFLRYAPGDRNLPWEDKIMVCDTALKKGEGNDWWVIQTWGRIGRKCYLLYSVRVQCNTAEFIKLCINEYRNRMADQPNHPVGRFIIEDSAAGPGVISALNEAGIPATPIIPIKDKAARVNDVLPYIETGCAYLPPDKDDPISEPWLPDLLMELGAFMQDLSHEHDDQCLVAGTKVSTRRGDIPIESVTTEDEVLTRLGWKRVLWSGQTGVANDLIEIETSSGLTLVGTAAHPIWSQDKLCFVRLDSLRYSDTILTASAESLSRRLAIALPIAPRSALDALHERTLSIALRKYATSAVNRTLCTASHRIRRVVASARGDVRGEPVYNLKIEGTPEFFANGILVHNCDVVAYSLSELLGAGLSILQVLGITV